MNALATRLFLPIVALAPIVLVATILAFTARTRQAVVFGVSLPLEMAQSARVAAAVKRFQIVVLTLGSVLVASGLALLATDHLRLASIAIPFSPLVLIGLAIVLRIRQARSWRPYQEAHPLERTADLSHVNNRAPLAAMLCAMLPLLVTAIWLRSHLWLLPEQWPTHWSAQGVADGWSTRNGMKPFLPLIFGATITAIMCCTFGILSTQRASEPGRRHRLLWPLAMLAWTLSLFACGLALLPLLSHPNADNALALATAQVVAIALILCWAFQRVGFFRSGGPSSEAYDGTSDAKWHVGALFYANRNDPALLVPRRFGVGWALNVGRPAVWWLSALVLCLAAAPVVLFTLFR